MPKKSLYGSGTKTTFNRGNVQFIGLIKKRALTF